MISQYHGDVMCFGRSPRTWHKNTKSVAVFFPVAMLFVALLMYGSYYAHQSVMRSQRETIMRAQRARNLLALYVALVCYADDHGGLPPAHTTNRAGRPMHTWRVLLLPYLGEKSLYSQINRNEPWDNTANRRLSGLMPEHYRSPLEAERHGATTSYFAVLGSHAPWWSTGDVKPWEAAGSDEIMLIELVGSKTPWMEPRDLTLEQVLDILRPENGSGVGGRGGEVNYLTVSGKVRTIDPKIDRESLRKLLLGEVGESVKGGRER